MPDVKEQACEFDEKFDLQFADGLAILLKCPVFASNRNSVTVSYTEVCGKNRYSIARLFQNNFTQSATNKRIASRFSGGLATGNHNTGIGALGYYWQSPDEPEQNPFVAMPSGNTIKSNIAEGQPWVDLFEAYWDFGDNLLLNPDGICRNTWQKNQFVTELGLPGCIGAPVMLDEKDVCALDDDD